MNDKVEQRVGNLTRRLRNLESAVVALSGGVDSSVLAVLAHEVLGPRMVAATALSPSTPRQDRLAAENLCRARGIPHRLVESQEFGDEAFLSNPEDRCYHCKRHLALALVALADALGLNAVVEGTNASDLKGHRPGHRAAEEHPRVVTPLVEAGMTKDDVRELARSLGLATADRPSSACLSSRIPTGTRLVPELLRRIDAAEECLREMGAGQVRLRHHGEIVRVEVDPQEMGIVVERREEVVRRLREFGWTFVTLDLIGYRTGGMRG